MILNIVDVIRTTDFLIVEVRNEKQSVVIDASYNRGTVWICNQNASHRNLRGAGRVFNGFEESIEHYRSSFMKAAIALVQTMF